MPASPTLTALLALAGGLAALAAADETGDDCPCSYPAGTPSRRRDCHSAAPRTTLSWCVDMGEKGVSVN